MCGRIFLHKLGPLIPGVKLHLNASIYLGIVADQIYLFFIFFMAASSKNNATATLFIFSECLQKHDGDLDVLLLRCSLHVLI